MEPSSSLQQQYGGESGEPASSLQQQYGGESGEPASSLQQPYGGESGGPAPNLPDDLLEEILSIGFAAPVLPRSYGTPDLLQLDNSDPQDIKTEDAFCGGVESSISAALTSPVSVESSSSTTFNSPVSSLRGITTPHLQDEYDQYYDLEEDCPIKLLEE